MKTAKVIIVILSLVGIGLVTWSLYGVNSLFGGSAPEAGSRRSAPQALNAQAPAKSLHPLAGDGEPKIIQIDRKTAEAPATASGPRAPVAFVNGTAITAGELDQELNHLLISKTSHAGIEPKKKDELRKTALDELIVRELAYQRAKSIGLKMAGIELIHELRRIKGRYKSEKSFRQALAADQITEPELEHRIEKDLLLKRIFELEIGEKARVSEQDTRKYYDENKAKFVVPESIQLKAIVIKVEPGKEAEAERKINEVFNKLKAGGDFGEVAYKFSEDDYRLMSGEYGSVHRGQLVPDLESVVFSQNPGGISAPFRISLGWHITKVTSKQPERQLRYEEVKEKIKNALQQQRQMARRVDFINGLKAATKIEYVD
jgi:parvulin-like peptidyl-prolyl isomerase